MRLQGKRAIVTGGGAGIGRAIAERFVQDGAAVAIVDIDGATAQAAAKVIAATGGRAVGIQADVAKLDDCRRAVETTAKELGGIDILINNAGLPSSYSEGTNLSRWDLGIETTLSSAYRMSELALPHLQAGSEPAIVHVCSIAGTLMSTPAAWYAASKAGLTGVAKSQARTYGKQGIRVNCLCLGVIATQRTKTIRESQKALDVHNARSCLGRVGRPEEAASAALFLVSADASYVTGTVLVADGGFSIG
ncbi:MAG: SDR family oxidoreductase [Chloroflexi bacterium]|nr:SDR family oxidoreductase [Chloroflexota bacterium]